MGYETAPEHVRLAVDLIRKVESMGVCEHVIIEATILVMQDTLNKLPRDERFVWRNRLNRVFSLPASGFAEVSFYTATGCPANDVFVTPGDKK